MMNQKNKEKSTLIEKVIEVQRNSRTIAGGRIMSFSALAVVGNGEDSVGYGRGKALEVGKAVRKAIVQATKNMQKVNYNLKKETIFYESKFRYNATTIYVKPASQGTGIVASNTIKSICTAVGIKNLICKVHGSCTKAVVVKCFIDFLFRAKVPYYFAHKRGLNLKQILTYEQS